MSIQRERRLGILLSYAHTAIGVALGLFYTPFLLSLMGKGEYGLYQMVASLTSNLGLLNLGFNGAYTRFYTKSRAAGGDEEQRINGLFLLVYAVIALVTAVVGVILLCFSEQILGAQLTQGEHKEAKILLALLTINMSISFLSNVFHAYTNVQERFVLQRGLEIVCVLLSPVVTITLCLCGYGAVSCAIAGLTITVFSSSVLVFYDIKKLGFAAKLEIQDIHRLKEIVPFTTFVFLSTVVGQINKSIDKFIIGHICGTFQVTIYSMGFMFTAYYEQFAAAIASVYTPQLHRLVIQKKDFQQVNQIFCRVGRMQFMILLLCISGFICFGQQFIYLWLGEGFEESYYVCLCIMIPLTIPLMQRTAIEIQRAMAKHQFRAIVTFIMAIINLVLTIYLCPKYGVVSCAFATGLSYIICHFMILNIFYHKKLQLDMIRFWKTILHVIPCVLPAAVIGGIYTRLINAAGSWVQWALGVALYTITYLGCIYLWELQPEEKNRVCSFLKINGKKTKQD